MNNSERSYLTDDDLAVKAIRQYLEYEYKESGKQSAINLFEINFGPAVAGLLCAAIGAWIFGIDRQSQVYVFCAISIAYSIGKQSIGGNTPEVHIAGALKALTVATYRRK